MHVVLRAHMKKIFSEDKGKKMQRSTESIQAVQFSRFPISKQQTGRASTRPRLFLAHRWNAGDSLIMALHSAVVCLYKCAEEDEWDSLFMKVRGNWFFGFAFVCCSM